MTIRKTLCGLGLLALVVAVGACSGGGGGGTTAGTPGAAPTPGGTESSSPLEQVVVRYDVNGDDNPDLVTLDRTTDPYTIVEALIATDTGDSVDRTATLKGAAIDSDVSRALALWLSTSVDVASGQVLDVVESDGRATTVTVYE